MISALKRIPRNAALLITLLGLIVLSPLLPIGQYWAIIELLFDLILLAGVYSVGPTRHRSAFLVLTVVTLAVRWGELLSGMTGLDLGALTLTVVWLFYALSIIVAHLFQRRDVTLNTILGAVVTYLLAAVAFSQVFQILELLDEGAFSGLSDAALGDRPELSNALMYFSLVCITTMGYGDIVPVSNLARSLSVLEGAFGQLYLAVMIARLVGLHLAGERDTVD
jgi:hypothetical protein